MTWMATEMVRGARTARVGLHSLKGHSQSLVPLSEAQNEALGQPYLFKKVLGGT